MDTWTGDLVTAATDGVVAACEGDESTPSANALSARADELLQTERYVTSYTSYIREHVLQVRARTNVRVLTPSVVCPHATHARPMQTRLVEECCRAVLLLVGYALSSCCVFRGVLVSLPCICSRPPTALGCTHQGAARLPPAHSGRHDVAHGH